MHCKKILFILSFFLVFSFYDRELTADWSPPEQISLGTASLNIGSSPIAIDNNSIALVGWLDGFIGVGQTLSSSQLFPQSNNWTFPELIYTNTVVGSIPSFPTMVVDMFGNQIAGFGVIDTINGTFTLNASRRPVGTTTWQPPIMQLLNGTPGAGSVAGGSLGDLSAILALTTTGTPPFDITLLQLPPNSSAWLPPVVLAQDNSTQPVVAAHPDHDFAIFAWKTNIPTLQLQTARYEILTQQIIPLPNVPLPPLTSDIVFIDVAVDAQEDSIMIFGVNIGGNYLLYSTTLFSGQNAWTTPILISDPANKAIGASIDSDRQGNSMILWGEQITPTQEFIRVASLPLGGTPTITNLTSPGNLNTTVDASSPIDVDSFGNAVAIWTITTGGVSMVQVSSKAINQPWTSPVTLSNTGYIPFVALSDQGTAVAVWLDSVTNILYGSRNLYLFPLMPPSNFIGTINETITPQGNTFSLNMNWLPSPAPNIVSYEIYQDGVLIGTVSGNGPFTFTFPLSSSTTSSVYTLIAVASNGNRSLPITLTILPPLAPPTNFFGKVIKNEFLTDIVYFLKLTWEPSPADNIAFYQIFKNGRLIATIPSTSRLKYLQPLHSKHVKGEYILRAVATDGTYSFSVPLVIGNDN